MPDQETAGFASISQIAGADIFYVIQDPAGAQNDRNISATDLFGNVPVATKVDFASTTAFVVEDDGTTDNVLVVDTSNGRVGILTTPNNALDVAGDATIGDGAGAAILDIDGAAGSIRRISFLSGGSNRWFIQAGADTESGSNAGSRLQIVRRADDGSLIDIAMSIDRASGEVNVANDLTVDGDLGVGTTPPGATLDVAGNSIIAGSASFYLSKISNSRGDSQGWGLRIEAGESADSTPSGRYIGFNALDGTAVGNITGDSSGGVNYNSSSDQRNKTDIEPLADALAVVLALEPKRYRGKGAPAETPKIAGFLAQQVQGHAPDTVSEVPIIDDEDNVVGTQLGMDYSRLTPYLAGAIQELESRVAALEAA